jgi:hypothetical protein
LTIRADRTVTEEIDMTLARSQITADLMLQFPAMFRDTEHAPYFDNYARIGAFLTDLGEVKDQLAALEQRVENRLLTRRVTIPAYGAASEHAAWRAISQRRRRNSAASRNGSSEPMRERRSRRIRRSASC